MKKLIAILTAVFMLSACTGGNTVATLGKSKITRGEFEFYLSSIKSQMSVPEIQTDEDWENKEIEGKKAIDAAKQRAMDIAVKNVEYCDLAELAGVEYSDEDKKTEKQMKARLIENNGGNSGYKKFLKENGITDKFMDMMCRSTIYYQKISDLVTEKYPITEEALNAKFESASIRGNYKKAKHILFLTVDAETNAPLSDEEQQEAKRLAEETLAKIDAGADFDKLMNELSQDPGLAENPDGYVFTPGEMVAEFEQAVELSDKGQAVLCKSDYGYHIVKQLTLELDDVRDKLEAEITDELVDAQLTEWEKEFDYRVIRNEEILKEIK